MKTFKDRLEAKEIDCGIIPCILNNKTLCKCPPICLSNQLLEFSLKLNRMKNYGNCPSSSQGIQSTQAGPGIYNYCPTRVPWKTIHQQKTGKKLVLTPQQMIALYDYLNTKKSKFGPILREVLNQLATKRFATQRVNCPSSTQGIQSSQPGAREFCVKTEHRYKRKIKSTCHDNCCSLSKKTCSKKGQCKKTSCF